MHFAVLSSESVSFPLLGRKVSNWQIILSAPEMVHL